MEREAEIDYDQVYDRLFGRAREFNREHPQPTLRSDLCGYEYSTLLEGQNATCSWCFAVAPAVRDVTRRVQVAFSDPSSALGRRQSSLGIACGHACADAMYQNWKCHHPELCFGV